jgi:hypothetical protein
MDNRIEFAAPWSAALRATSVAATLLFLGVAAFGLLSPGLPRSARLALTVLPPLMLVVGALGTVRGYGLTPGTLWVRRLLWDTRISLEGLRACRVEPEAARPTLRLFGNGGLYAYSGWFWNRRLGRFRLYATNLDRPVVLRFDRRVVVISPDRPEEFGRTVVAQLPRN